MLCVLILGEAGLRAVREELEKVDATEKETDLFRFFQTEDFAARLSKAATEESSPKKRRIEKKSSALESIARLFGSQDYRSLIQEITGCGELSERVDLATQVYTKGSHLLCHDDVIGTRKVSFIYYMTDPEEEWSKEEGGALELFPSNPAQKGTPASIPTKELLPMSDSLAIFLVEPGVSFHAVREVRGDRARVSLQGWLHAPSLEETRNFGQRDLATLQQILDTRAGAGKVEPEEVEEPLADLGELTQEDWKLLSKWLAPSYCDPKQLQAVAGEFSESSYAVLAEFLRPDLAKEVSEDLEAVDAADGFEPDAEETVPKYDTGLCDGWELVGPPHLRRFLRYGGCQEGSKEATPHARLGKTMASLAEELFASDSFLRWLRACTGLDPRSRGRPQVRRFRPGMDYTVAAKAAGQEEEAAELDAILTFALGDSSCEKSQAEDLKGAASEQWASEEVGGFECYLAADEDEETVEAQEVYRGADTDGPLVNLPAVPNALCLVMRDSKTLRFLKYLSRDAPSSRADISASYRVDAPESSEEEDEGVGEDAAA